MEAIDLTPDPEILIRAAKQRAKILGCNCNPDIVIRTLAPGIYDAEIYHDDWCKIYE